MYLIKIKIDKDLLSIKRLFVVTCNLCCNTISQSYAMLFSTNIAMWDNFNCFPCNIAARIDVFAQGVKQDLKMNLSILILSLHCVNAVRLMKLLDRENGMKTSLSQWISFL